MKILVLGDEMVDRYWVGACRRKNPDGECPLVDVDEVLDLPGGAANVARNLELLGADPFLVSGGQSSQGIVKNRVLAGPGPGILRFDQSSRLDPIFKRWDPNSLARVCKWDAVVVSDYAKGSVDDSVADWVRGLCLPTYVDCKSRPDRWVKWATCMFPNEGEWTRNRLDYQEAHMVLVKRGLRGATVTMGTGLNHLSISHPSLASRCVNATGAGDTAMAAFVIGHSVGGFNLEGLLEFSMQASALAVEHLTTFAGTIDDVVERFNLGPESVACRTRDSIVKNRLSRQGTAR